MISLKGPGLKIFAAILAVIALGFGIYSTFFRSAGFVDSTATIISVEEDPDYIPDADKPNDVQYIVIPPTRSAARLQSSTTPTIPPKLPQALVSVSPL